MPERAQLDHTVINVQFDMDRAQGLFEDLGFSLTDRGYHSLGSMNHLMIFGTDYMELIALPKDAVNPRKDIAEAPVGINGLVFKTPNVDDTFAHMQSLGIAGDPPKAFTRPVELPGGAKDAAFRTVAVAQGTFPGGRVYYCEHATPELVWRPEWQNHANGALAMPEFVIASTDHGGEASRFAKLLHAEVTGIGNSLAVPISNARITVMTPDAYAARYGDLASAMAGRSSIFGALVVKTDSLNKIRDIVAGMDNPVPMIDDGRRVIVRQPDFDTVLEFVV